MVVTSPFFGKDRGLAGVHQHKAAGAEGVLGRAGGPAGLAEQGGLLVARRPGDLDAAAKVHGVGIFIKAAGGHGLRQHTPGDIQHPQDLVVPVKGVDVEQHGAAGVGIIGDVDLAAGQFPDQPGLHRAEQQLAGLGLLPRAGDVVQDPFQLGGRKVGVDDKARLLPEGFGVAAGLQLVAVGAGAPALPDDGVVDRLAGVPVPDDGGLALVGDADGGDVGGRRADLVHGRQGHPQLGGPDLVGVVLHPAGLREILGEFLLGDAAHFPRFVEQDAPVGVVPASRAII